tara:strand:+ start:445 stop:1215 length:771 start_codon:yes stop_codon:yes gene_type:complete
MNLVVLVLDSFTPNSIRNTAIQKQTWAKDASKNCEVLFYKGDRFTKRENFDLILNCSDTYQDMGIKTVKAFEWVNENLNYDYVFRTNTSSYVHYENLIKYTTKLANNGVHYCGFIGHYNGVDYVSGSGIILSKKSVQTIIKSQENLDDKIVEDIAIGKLLKSYSIFPTEGKRQDIESHQDIMNLDSNQYHIRCRLDSFGYSRNIEKYILRYIHKNLHKKKKLFELFMVIYMKVNKSTLIIQKKIKNIIKSVLNNST